VIGDTPYDAIAARKAKLKIIGVLSGGFPEDHRVPGFDPAMLDLQQNGPGGLGLFSIRERVISFEGKLQIESAPGRGTRITLVAPCC
jgi:hypothetical protein